MSFLDDEHKENVKLIGKLMKDKRWKITDRLRVKVMDCLEEAVEHPDMDVAMKAIDLVMKADALNLAEEKMNGKIDGETEPLEQKTVLLLPVNGTESRSTVEN